MKYKVVVTDRYGSVIQEQPHSSYASAERAAMWARLTKGGCRVEVVEAEPKRPATK